MIVISYIVRSVTVNSKFIFLIPFIFSCFCNVIVTTMESGYYSEHRWIMVTNCSDNHNHNIQTDLSWSILLLKLEMRNGTYID